MGKNIAKDLKAFGWSFSQPWDVDGNHYVGKENMNNSILVVLCESMRIKTVEEQSNHRE